MSSAFALPGSDLPDAVTLRGMLAREEAQRHASGVMLPFLLIDSDDGLHTEAIVSNMRGLIRDLAGSVLAVLAEATGDKARDTFIEQHVDSLSNALSATPALTAHVHHLALEMRVADIVLDRLSLDSALSPLLQDLLGDEAPEVASTAMAALTAQTRFDRTSRRTQLPLTELPLEVLGALLACVRRDADDISTDGLTRAEQRIRSGFDESATRLSVIERLFALTADRRGEWLQMERAGPALFLTGLARSTRQSRDSVAAACVTRSQARLALSLRAAGLRARPIERQCELLAVSGDHLGGLDDIGIGEASQLLGISGASHAR